MMENIKTLRIYLLPISILAFTIIFSAGATLASGFDQTFLQEIMQYVSIFGGYFIEIIVMILSLLFIWKREYFKFVKDEMTVIYVSLGISSVYVLLFTVIWLGILQTGIH